MMFDGIQDFCGEVNQAACYALCLLKVAEKYNKSKNKDYPGINVLEIFDNACGLSKNDIIYYNYNNLEDNNNFYVQYPEELLKIATRKKWSVRKENNLSYKPAKDEFIIKRYERIKTGSVIGHFEMDDFHPIKNSYTVKYGKVVSLRVLKVYE